MDEDDEQDGYIYITEKGAVIANVAPKLMGYGLTARQILDSFSVEVDGLSDEDTEGILGLIMFTARHYGVI